jgi:hypothetical protein
MNRRARKALSHSVIQHRMKEQADRAKRDTRAQREAWRICPRCGAVATVDHTCKGTA